MSDTGDIPPKIPDRPLAARSDDIPASRHGCLTALMILVGIVLLLPGLCAVIFGAAAIYDPRNGAGFLGFILVGLMVGFGGVMLIRAAIRGSRW
jgi:hypothetical protein